MKGTHPDFKTYVVDLVRIAEATEHPDQQEAFDEVMRHGEHFWRMTWEG